MGFKDINFYGHDMNGDGNLDRDDDILYEYEMDEYDRFHKEGIYAESTPIEDDFDKKYNDFDEEEDDFDDDDFDDDDFDDDDFDDD